MSRRTTVAAGFHGGRFLPAGASYEDAERQDARCEPDTSLDRMTKEELLAEAERRGIQADPGLRKADIVARLKG